MIALLCSHACHCENGLKVIEFPPKSGIEIREVLNASGVEVYGGSYEVVIPAKVRGRGRGRGGRIRKRFKELGDAKRFAKQQHAGLGARGAAFLSLNTQLQDEVAALVPELEKSSQSLDELKGFLKRLDSDDVRLSDLGKGLSRSRTKGLDLERSVKFCETHLMPDGGEITFAKVVEEMISLKKERVENGLLRPVSLETFAYQTRRMQDPSGR